MLQRNAILWTTLLTISMVRKMLIRCACMCDIHLYMWTSLLIEHYTITLINSNPSLISLHVSVSFIERLWMDIPLVFCSGHINSQTSSDLDIRFVYMHNRPGSLGLYITNIIMPENILSRFQVQTHGELDTHVLYIIDRCIQSYHYHGNRCYRQIPPRDFQRNTLQIEPKRSQS